MVIEPWAARRDALCSEGGHEFGEARPHDIPDPVARDGQVDDRGELAGGLDDCRGVEHQRFLRVGVGRMSARVAHAAARREGEVIEVQVGGFRRPAG